MKQTKISYIIVTWNNEDIIQECLDTLLEFSSYDNEVIVIDNNSQDNTCLLIKERYGTKVNLIEAGENLGFSKANNTGLEVASGDYIFYVNPDVIFIEDIVSPMISLLENNPEIGIVSPKLLNLDKTYQVSSCNFPSFSKVIWDDCHLYNFLPKSMQMKYAQAQYKGSENRYVDWTYGAAHFCRHEDVKKTGGYPEGYFMYGEDTEFCMQFLSKLNKKTYYLGTSSLIHIGGYSEKQVINSKKIVYGTKAALYFVNKYYKKPNALAYKVSLALASLLKYIVYSVKVLIDKSQKNLNNKIKWRASWQTILTYRGEQN
ncbi:glycosyltransferase family 2 protein [Jeotgalibaca porci]|uniref:glycosyltransferase family 2 protein n=1 Tax=Jeotgalibaca porci TaxID=1868793 RepID=UPI003F91DF65